MANTMDFNLDKAYDDFYFLINMYGGSPRQYEYYIKCAVEAQIDNPFIYSAGYYQECIQKLKTAVGGYQIRMEGI